jgi:hypothetical protein
MKKLSLLLLVCMFSTLASAQLSLSPSSPSTLGNQPIGFLAGAPFTLFNTGTNSATIESITVSPSDQYLVYNNPGYNCPSQLSEGGACTIWIGFDPSGVGMLQGTVTVTYEILHNQGMVTANVTGNGISDVTLVPLTTPPYHIPCNVYVGGVSGDNSGPCTVSLVNQQPNALSISGVSVSTGFIVSANSCPTPPETLPALGSCTIVLEYNALEGNGAQGTLRVMTNSRDGSPPTLNLQGNCRHYGC